MLSISSEAIEYILRDSKESYPHECCGVLLGRFKEGTKEVLKARKATNTNTERAKDRYEIDPRELLEIEKEAKAAGVDVVGIYHSHPDHPARPSEFDRERGWPDYSYIIVSVEGGEKLVARSWSLNDIGGSFEEEEIRLIENK